MQIFVDADSCPVRDIIYEEAHKRGINIIMVVSMAHNIYELDGMSVLRVDSSFQAVDMAIVNKASSGDIVVTSDFGLASLVLGNGVFALSPSGLIYTVHAMDSLLERRHASARQRRGGRRVKGPKARRREDDNRFRKNLIMVMEQG
ncbi:MAG: YaiI/YqxD family protein [Nitrospirae bacterium]|nr:YaiI/YqxD family protein [Nitrospirota bacterium]